MTAFTHIRATSGETRSSIVSTGTKMLHWGGGSVFIAAQIERIKEGEDEDEGVTP